MFWQYCPAYRSLEEPIKFLDWFSVLPGRILAITNNEENQWNKMKALANYLLSCPWPQSIGGFTKESCHHHQIPFPVGGERLRMPVVVKSSHRSRWIIFIVKFAQLVYWLYLGALPDFLENIIQWPADSSCPILADLFQTSWRYCWALWVLYKAMFGDQ